MQIFAVFDDDGLPTGFYTPGIHAEIPTKACRISVKQWHEFITNKGQRRWDGEKVVEYFPESSPGPAYSSILGQFVGPMLLLFNNYRRLA
jgi:hypothetical protein